MVERQQCDLVEGGDPGGMQEESSPCFNARCAIHHLWWLDRDEDHNDRSHLENALWHIRREMTRRGYASDE